MPTLTPTSQLSPKPLDDVRRAAHFLVRIFPERAFQIRLWDGTEVPGTEPGQLTLVINSPGALRRMFRLPIELRLGEAFLRGDFDIEGEVSSAGPLLAAARGVARSPAELGALTRLWLRLAPGDSGDIRSGRYGAPARLRGEKGSREWDREGIRYHYDAGNDFYALFLDSRMVYSCAYFPTGTEDLDTAQELKLEHICRKLRLRPGDRLLDIGCGWGALAVHAAERHGASVVGVTLSGEQHAFACRRVAEHGLQDRVTIRCQDYRDVADERFDKIASVGMFEHVGPARLPEYFRHVFRILRPGGLFLNHGIAGRPRPAVGFGAGIRRALEPFVIGGSTFRERYVFPNGGLAPVSRSNLVAEEGGFEVRDVESLREHYMRTLRLWAERLHANADEAIQLGGLGMYRLWRLYMGIASWQFESGEFGVYQSLLEKPAGGPSSLPPSRRDLYR
jgi:cyclopropane-fatty-acyl-phospholipid synthase